MGEKCDRCGNTGQDRRNLWHACFYEMNELGLPFEVVPVEGQGRFYTLRVCKRCRADWMEAVKAWFGAAPSGADDDADEPAPDTGPGTGIFVRRNGVNVEVTEEEWRRTCEERGEPGREPVRYTPAP